jgi:hypothetical protein
MEKYMNNSRMTRHARLLLLACVALLLSACAATRPAEHPVVERSEARWNALIAGDLETAYTFYTPGYRSATSLIDFGVEMRTKRVRWTSAEYLKHECDEDRCTVYFKLGFQVRGALPGISVFNSFDYVEDTWIRTRGQWWYLPENKELVP